MDDHAPTAWVHEHGYLSLPPFPTSVAAGRTRISHLVSRPWAYVPTWILAAVALPGLYGIVRGITLWPDLPTLPRRLAQGLSRPRLAPPSLPTPHPGALSSQPVSHRHKGDAALPPIHHRFTSGKLTP